MPRKSRNRQMFEKALERKGYRISFIQWEPIGGNIEMCGPSGGWTLMVSHSNDYLLGYNAAEIMEEIDRLPNLSQKEAAHA